MTRSRSPWAPSSARRPRTLVLVRGRRDKRRGAAAEHVVERLARSDLLRQRLVTCEKVSELRVPLPDVVATQTRQPNLEGAGEIPLRRLVKEALRMRPSRIVVGEVRQEECLDLLIALDCGLPGLPDRG
jgi:Tfp pilus assembly ATPase PilU